LLRSCVNSMDDGSVWYYQEIYLKYCKTTPLRSWKLAIVVAEERGRILDIIKPGEAALMPSINSICKMGTHAQGYKPCVSTFANPGGAPSSPAKSASFNHLLILGYMM
ncbi:hypothetical protein EJB05_02912, partial [Eragrostis curvula]